MIQHAQSGQPRDPRIMVFDDLTIKGMSCQCVHVWIPSNSMEYLHTSCLQYITRNYNLCIYLKITRHMWPWECSAFCWFSQMVTFPRGTALAVLWHSHLTKWESGRWFGFVMAGGLLWQWALWCLVFFVAPNPVVRTVIKKINMKMQYW